MNRMKPDYLPFYKDVGALFENFLRAQPEDSSFVDTASWAPPVDIKEEKDRFVVISDIPGVKKEDIHISLENNVLTIKGRRQFEKTEEKTGYSRVERMQGQFCRRFSLPQTADDAKISAKCKNGVLEIGIPKKENAVEKRIEIEIEED